MALARYRTKGEVLRIVRTLAPEPSVPDRVEPLGPETVGIALPRPPTWRGLVESLAAGVRELAPGDRPKDWIDRASAASEGERDARQEVAEEGRSDCVSDLSASGQRYKVQFTASQEYADLLERAQALLSHAVPNRSLEEVHLRALRLLVERLEKRKYGALRPRVPAAPPRKSCARHPRRSGPAAVWREVRNREGVQCSYVDERGRRCRETRFLELHHELAQGGPETAHNLSLRCQAHNALAAEHDFGREFMNRCREASRSPPRP